MAILLEAGSCLNAQTLGGETALMKVKIVKNVEEKNQLLQIMILLYDNYLVVFLRLRCFSSFHVFQLLQMSRFVYYS